MGTGKGVTDLTTFEARSAPRSPEDTFPIVQARDLVQSLAQVSFLRAKPRRIIDDAGQGPQVIAGPATEDHCHLTS